MALSQAQIQALQQKLSPQQIQFIKLLQMNTLDFESRLTEELLDNPALEKGQNDQEFAESNAGADAEFDDFVKEYVTGNLSEFFNENTKIHMKMKINLREYLIITNKLYPTLIKWEEIVYFDK